MNNLEASYNKILEVVNQVEAESNFYPKCGSLN
jgi:hypothetical protein